MHQVRTPPPRPSLSRVGLPNALDAVFRRALAKDPSARYRTCAELVNAISAAMHGRATAAAAAPMGRSAFTVAAVALAAVLVMGGVVAAANSFSAGSSQPPVAAVTQTFVATGAATPPTVTAATPTVAAGLTATPQASPTAPPLVLTTTPTLVPTRPPATPTVPPVAPSVTPAPAPPGASGSLVLVSDNDRGGKDLFRMGLTGGGLTRLTGPTATWNWAPASSCDGQWLAFATGTPGKSDIAIMRSNGSQRSVIAHSGSLAFGSPWWMPDGRVAFNGSTGTSWEIYAVSPAGGTPTAVTSTPNMDGTRLPSWPCQEAGSLAVAANENGQFRVFLQSANQTFTPVSPAGSEGYAPAWSRDGERLAFQSGGGALNGIVTMAANGSNPQRVAAPVAGAWARAPIWSPDGRWIAYVSSSRTDDTGDVFLVPSNGGAARQLTFDNSTYDWRLAWLP
jgi:hypothetical protein